MYGWMANAPMSWNCLRQTMQLDLQIPRSPCLSASEKPSMVSGFFLRWPGDARCFCDHGLWGKTRTLLRVILTITWSPTYRLTFSLRCVLTFFSWHSLFWRGTCYIFWHVTSIWRIFMQVVWHLSSYLILIYFGYTLTFCLTHVQTFSDKCFDILFEFRQFDFPHQMSPAALLLQCPRKQKTILQSRPRTSRSGIVCRSTTVIFNLHTIKLTPKNLTQKSDVDR